MNRGNEGLRRSSLQQRRVPGAGLSRWLAFFLGLVLLIFVGTFSLNKTVFKADVAVAEITKPVYVNEATTTLNQVVAALAAENNIPTAVTQNLLTKAQVKTDLAALTRNVYAGKQQLIETTTVKQQIGENIAQKAQKVGIPTSNALYQSAQNTFLDGLGEYLNKKVSATSAPRLATTLSTAVKLNRGLLFGSLILGIVLLLLQLFHERSFLRWLHYLGLAALVSGLLLLVAAFLIGNSGIITTVSAQAQQASGLVATLLEKAFNQMQVSGVWLSGCGILGLVLGFFRKK
ncbi:hypothetical protein [Liquorilactobacillus satsumensis]|uniref:hypothetical protein n=1 Tax=Liquorilactobacillus satsumensis TaxID=259059 RepID=UPI001E340098|nr:hypothetical protein [Liquorilactobacillus satsumensis]MCC7667812.1 hypothetical protein [Liquorilactobacillus satsumensis]MCP9312435.1 hypothetical protein [Liquorilactobacillus satsumensis]MCP9358556.1 hypothetical protein [Liquorilactobacillus satsumensis]MCP9359724.1 hypothetical protein [Liquorilactobacillus satsumensis]MCP9372488.1 hypothetical protein [Liquorilactobacillus satsumensis]